MRERLVEIRRWLAADRRLFTALGSYAALALLAMILLGGFLRGAVLGLLAILAVKTLIHSRQADRD